MICYTCKVPKSENEFIRNSQRASGRGPYCRECWNIKNDSNRIQRRIKILLSLGGKCEICSENRLIFLVIDHKQGGGRIDQKERGTSWFVKAARNGTLTSDKYRVLCHNCNGVDLIKRSKARRTPGAMNPSEAEVAKQQIITLLGGQCICCGELDHDKLVIDHKNNNPKSLLCPRKARALYRYIILNKVSADEFQLLCWNCNHGKRLGFCPSEHQV